MLVKSTAKADDVECPEGEVNFVPILISESVADILGAKAEHTRDVDESLLVGEHQTGVMAIDLNPDAAAEFGMSMAKKKQEFADFDLAELSLDKFDGFDLGNLDKFELDKFEFDKLEFDQLDQLELDKFGLFDLDQLDLKDLVKFGSLDDLVVDKIKVNGVENLGKKVLLRMSVQQSVDMGDKVLSVAVAVVGVAVSTVSGPESSCCCYLGVQRICPVVRPMFRQDAVRQSAHIRGMGTPFALPPP